MTRRDADAEEEHSFPMRLSYRARTFLAMFGVAAAAVILAGSLLASYLGIQTASRIERTLVTEARLIADVLSRSAGMVSEVELDEEARRVGQGDGARVTFVAGDGQVVADSGVAARDLATVGNHGTRPEIVAAIRDGLGIARRYSATLRADMLYVAVPARHPRVAVVRLAMPLTDVTEQLQSVRRVTLLALGVALAGALALAWAGSAFLMRQVKALAAAAQRYAAGDLSKPAGKYGKDELGTVAGVLDDSVREIARRAAEVSENQARTEAILAGMLEGVLVADAQGQVQLINDAARHMLGLDEGVVGHHYLDAIRHPGLVELLGGVLQRQEAGSMELALGGSPERMFVARAAPVVAPAFLGAVLVLHDITGLHTADRVRRDFVANVSHELRTPLTAISGYVEALRDEPPDSADSHRFLEIIARHTERMERLLRDLLQLARLDARQDPVEVAPCSIEELFAGAVSDLDPSIEAKRQRVETRVDPEVATIVTDATKLQDALHNIIDNAANYSPAGSTIRLEATQRDDRVVLSVTDEGPGIPEADLARIFERFYRVDKARSRESGGTGLGLSIVRHLVGRLSGDVSAANRPEGGAVFTITLPLQPPRRD